MNHRPSPHETHEPKEGVSENGNCMCWVEIFTCVIFERIAFFYSYFQHIGAYFMFIIITANELVVLEFCSYFSFLLSLLFFCIFIFLFYGWVYSFFCGNSSSCLLNHIANYAKTRRKNDGTNEWAYIHCVQTHIRGYIFWLFSLFVPHTIRRFTQIRI